MLARIGVADAEQPFAVGGAKRRSSLLTAVLRRGQDALKVAVASQGSEVFPL